MKTAESIDDTPSSFVTCHVKEPHVAFRPYVLVASESVQLKTLAALLTLYIKAGVANLAVFIVRVSV